MDVTSGGKRKVWDKWENGRTGKQKAEQKNKKSIKAGQTHKPPWMDGPGEWKGV